MGENIEMTAIEYMQGVKYMTNYCRINCNKCPLGEDRNGTSYGCREFEDYYPEKAIEIVKKWLEENPVLTILDKFIEVFPNAKLNNGAFPVAICTSFIGFKKLGQCDMGIDGCLKC